MEEDPDNTGDKRQHKPQVKASRQRAAKRDVSRLDLCWAVGIFHPQGTFCKFMVFGMGLFPGPGLLAWSRAGTLPLSGLVLVVSFFRGPGQ